MDDFVKLKPGGTKDFLRGNGHAAQHTGADRGKGLLGLLDAEGIVPLAGGWRGI